MSNVGGSKKFNFDGNYNNLTNKPTIPTDNLQIANGRGYITSSGESNAPSFPETLGTGGQIIRLQSTPANGFEYVDFPTFSQTQADFDETDNQQASFIKNKPSLENYALDASLVDLSNIVTNNIDTLNDLSTNYYAYKTSNDSAVSTNTSNISTNTSNIATNTSAITTNTSNISTNTSNISTNTSDIEDLSTNYYAYKTSNNSAVSTNTSNISTNTSNISTNTSNISTNTSDIEDISSTINSYGTAVTKDFRTSVASGDGRLVTSAGVYTKLQNYALDASLVDLSDNVDDYVTSVNEYISSNNQTFNDLSTNYYAYKTSNDSAVSTNTSNISTNTSNISTNTSNISTNTSNIASNTSAIATNASAIATNTSNISTNTSNISTNTSNISTNTSNISTNTSNISTNASTIEDLSTNFYTTNSPGYLTNSITNQISITNDSTPQLKIQRNSTGACILRLQGERSSGTNQSASIEFYNYSATTNDTHAFGRIFSRLQAAATNTGKMMFQVSNDGSSWGTALELRRNKDAFFGADLSVTENLSVTGFVTATDYTFSINAGGDTSTVKALYDTVSNNTTNLNDLSSNFYNLNAYTTTSSISITSSDRISLTTGTNKPLVINTNTAALMQLGNMAILSDNSTDNGGIEADLLLSALSDGHDAKFSIRGFRNGGTNQKQAEISLENYDSNVSTTLQPDYIGKLGVISGEVTNATTNVGDMVFYSSSDGVATTETMRIKSNNSIEISGNLTVTGGTITSSIAGSIIPVRTLVGDFELNVSRNMNTGPVHTWDTTINSLGIVHTNSTNTPQGSLFTCNQAGTFHFNIRLSCSQSQKNSRTYLTLDMRVYTGASSTTAYGTIYRTYTLGTGYCRSLSGTNQVVLAGDTTLTLNLNDQIEIRTIVEYTTNSAHTINTDVNDSYLIIERIDYQLP